MAEGRDHEKKKRGKWRLLSNQYIYPVGIRGILPKPQKQNYDLSKEFYSSVELADYFKINIILKRF